MSEESYRANLMDVQIERLKGERDELRASLKEAVEILSGVYPYVSLSSDAGFMRRAIAFLHRQNASPEASSEVASEGSV